MERKKDISDLIKANQHRLNEAPSKHAWKKLESRLDAHKNKHQSSLYRQLAMVAAVVALVAVVSLLSIMQNRENGLMAVNADFDTVPSQLEAIESYTDVNPSIYHISDFQRKYQAKSITAINEGPKAKQLRPSPKLVSNQDIKYYAEAKKEVLKREKEMEINTETFATIPEVDYTADALANANKSKTTTTYVYDGNNTGYENPIAYNYSEEELEIVQPEPLEATSIDPPKAKHEIKKDSYAHDVELGRTAKVEVTAKDRRLEDQIEASDIVSAQKETYDQEIAEEDSNVDKAIASSAPSMSKKRQFKELNAQTNSIELEAFPEQANLALFKWLVGQWHGTTSNGLSIEQWQLKDEFTIEGTGYIIINGDTTFTEGMLIQKIDQDVYYILSLDQSKEPVHFKLKSYTNQQAVFENAQLSFPNQLILQQNNQNNFSTILQNKAPAQIKLEQQKYIQNRNFIQNEQAVRNLSRIKQ